MNKHISLVLVVLLCFETETETLFHKSKKNVLHNYPNTVKQRNPKSNTAFQFLIKSFRHSQTVNDLLLAVESFMRLHPKYADFDLYLAGESYAGIHIPALAARIFDTPRTTRLARKLRVSDKNKN